MTGLSIEIAEKTFPADGDGPPRRLYRDFRLDVADGGFVALLGPSGLGKTTLLNMIAGVDRDFAGRVAFSRGPDPRIGYVFQSPRLLPWRTVLQNVVLPLPKSRDSERRAKVVLEEMGLGDAEDVYPERLSLGMQRRVALARAFALEPDLLLMDEPFVSLDEANADRLRDLLAELIAARPTTVLFVTHDSREAVRLADRVVVLAGPPAVVARDVSVDLTLESRRIPGEIERVRAVVLKSGPTVVPLNL
ncbi:ABC transporter ATP-binding protein [Hansschlegelia plantiphila]|uniref:ABC transporter ATP-binding protein n=1 Tax=Hansschlegelia plantiphila TaxID=374655 RepID=A0A9W6J1U5_9HYPH|nr:ABC transporter ATP-binding protein [Hansschlegelia plantiphila]GLK69137.1 ABC transporter ATP-binding protein [Hansschlegelia plantiphila]